MRHSLEGVFVSRRLFVISVVDTRVLQTSDDCIHKNL